MDNAVWFDLLPQSYPPALIPCGDVLPNFITFSSADNSEVRQLDFLVLYPRPSAPGHLSACFSHASSALKPFRVSVQSVSCLSLSPGKILQGRSHVLLKVTSVP
jgi:hypothetical protein